MITLVFLFDPSLYLYIALCTTHTNWLTTGHQMLRYYIVIIHNNSYYSYYYFVGIWYPTETGFLLFTF